MERKGGNVFTYDNFVPYRYLHVYTHTHKGKFQVRVTIMQHTSRSRTSNRLRISGLSNWAFVALTAVSRIPVRLCWYKVVAGRASSGLVVMKQSQHITEILCSSNSVVTAAHSKTLFQPTFKTSHIILSDLIMKKISEQNICTEYEQNISIHMQLHSWILAWGVT